ncbi:hypothetical protein ABPG72_009129 [Tetrahymena utriculariae]
MSKNTFFGNGTNKYEDPQDIRSRGFNFQNNNRSHSSNHFAANSQNQNMNSNNNPAGFQHGLNNLNNNILSSNNNVSSSMSSNNNILKAKNTNHTTTTSNNSNQIQHNHCTNNNNNEDWTNEEKEGDTTEVKELKNRMKIVMNKFNNVKREKETLAKENKSLQDEVMTLQSNLRSMIQGFSNNTSSSFPMQNELTVQIAEFYKYDCLDLFFDVLCQELNMKGIIYFFKTAFQRLLDTVNSYLQPSVDAIKTVGCFENLDGPILNVLRKSYQLNYKQMIQKCFNRSCVSGITDEIQNSLKLGGLSSETHTTISQFIQKMGEIIFLTQISDPPLYVDSKQVGSKVQFNSLKHDPFDGFIKSKEECIIILPSVHKGNIPEGEIVSKALVLQSNYEIPG